MAATDPLIGKEFKFYRIVDKIGGGAFGAVYRAEHTRVPKPFAIKILHPHIASDELIVGRFEREARTLATLNHPNIVQLVDFDRDDEVGLYLVMEWLRGASMKQIIQKKKRLPLDVTCEFFQHLLSGLQEAHEHGIVHRDLKPANLMIIPAGGHQILKILDFGVASLSSDDRDLTMVGAAMGSANYMSPEQAMGNIKEVDNRSDLYSCGVILGHCLTGKRVFLGDTPTQTLMKHIHETPRSLHEMCPEEEFSPQIEAVFARSLAKRKEDRYQNAREFLDAVVDASKAIAGGRPRRGGPPSVTGIFQMPTQTGTFQAPNMTGTFMPPPQFSSSPAASYPPATHSTGSFTPLPQGGSSSGNVAAAPRPPTTRPHTGSFAGLPDPLAGSFRPTPLPHSPASGSPPIAGFRSTYDHFPAQSAPSAPSFSSDEQDALFSDLQSPHPPRSQTYPHTGAAPSFSSGSAGGGMSISEMRMAREQMDNERAAAPKYAREVLSLPTPVAAQVGADLLADAPQREPTRARRDWRAQDFSVQTQPPSEGPWERIERILDKHLRELILAVVLVAVVGLGLLAWRLSSPRKVEPQKTNSHMLTPQILPEPIPTPRSRQQLFPRRDEPKPAAKTPQPAKITDPKTADPKTADPKTTDPKTTDPNKSAPPSRDSGDSTQPSPPTNPPTQPR